MIDKLISMISLINLSDYLWWWNLSFNSPIKLNCEKLMIIIHELMNILIK